MPKLINTHRFAGPRDPDLARAQRRLEFVRAESREVIKILTAEEAMRAERVVREAGRQH